MKKDNGKGPRKLFPREEYSWRNMVSRCNNPKATGYSYYGGNGITFDPRWADFDLFYLDMGNVSKEGEMDYKNGKKPVRLIKQLIKFVSYKEIEAI